MAPSMEILQTLCLPKNIVQTQQMKAVFNYISHCLFDLNKTFSDPLHIMLAVGYSAGDYLDDVEIVNIGGGESKNAN